MNKMTHYYRQWLAVLTEKLQGGERHIDTLIEGMEQDLNRRNELTQDEMKNLKQALQRDLQEFARQYEDQPEGITDSVFMRIVKGTLWQELADITDKTQLEWREIFKDLNHHGVYRSGEIVGLGQLICEKCHHHLDCYTPDILPRCPHCGGDQFQRRPFQP